jgi:membrane protein
MNSLNRFIQKSKEIFTFIKKLGKEFSQDNVTKYSASLAYYTVFSLAPLIIIIVTVSGFIFGREAMQGELYYQLKDLVGSDAAVQIQSNIRNIHLSGDTPIATTISIVALLMGSTAIFGEIQDSLNKIWGLRIKSKGVWWKIILNRLLSFSVIISMGFLLIVSLLINALVAALKNWLIQNISITTEVFMSVFDVILSLFITSTIFAVIFKVLPDARIKWRDVIYGAIFTSVLFMLGKYGIAYYIGRSDFASLYGAAGSVIIILVWSYYSSVILFLGAEFTKVYASDYGGKIYPNDYSVWIKVEEVPVDHVTLAQEVKPKV